MQIKHEQTSGKGAFVIEDSGVRQGELEYSLAGTQRMIISHTEVSDALRGKGAGKDLVQAAVDYARANGMKIMPLCPFANAVFHRTPAYHDIWDR